MFDLRANVLERMGRIKDALKDTKRAIRLSPASPHVCASLVDLYSPFRFSHFTFQGYNRAARLFYVMKHFESASTMVSEGLRLATEKNSNLLGELRLIQENIDKSISAQKRKQSRKACHVANMPAELLGLVFEFWMQEDVSASVTASHICGHWRYVALNYPFLWTNLVVSRIDLPKRLEKKITQWSKRSGGRLEQLRADLVSLSDLQTLLTLLHTNNMTAPHSIHLSNCEPHPLQVHKMFRDIFGLAFNPRIVHINNVRKSPSSYPQDNLAHQFWSLNLEQSALEVLELTGWPFDWAVLEMHPNLRRLRLCKSETHNLSPNTFVTFLSSFPNLEFLELESMVVPRPHHAPNATNVNRLIMFSLKDLRLSGIRTDLVGLMQQLSFPSLNTLHLSSITATPVCRVVELVANEHSPPKSLKELHLVRVTIDARILIKALEKIGQDIEILRITHTAADVNLLLEAMAGQDSSGAVKPDERLCPQANTMDFSYCPTLSGGPIKALVKSRPDLGLESASIKSMVLDGCRGVQPELLPWLRTKVGMVSCLYETAASIRKTRR